MSRILMACSSATFSTSKLGYVEYTVPTERFGLSLYAGKFDSVLGYEYRACKRRRIASP